MSKKLKELKKAASDRFLNMSLRTKQLLVTLLGLLALVIFALVQWNALYRSALSNSFSLDIQPCRKAISSGAEINML